MIICQTLEQRRNEETRIGAGRFAGIQRKRLGADDVDKSLLGWNSRVAEVSARLALASCLQNRGSAEVTASDLPEYHDGLQFVSIQAYLNCWRSSGLAPRPLTNGF